MDIRHAPEERGPKAVRYSFLSELLETTHRNEAKLEKMLEKQEETTALVLSLKENRTIEKTNELWSTMSNVMFTGRVIVKVLGWALATVAVVLGIAYTLHQLFGWF